MTIEELRKAHEAYKRKQNDVSHNLPPGNWTNMMFRPSDIATKVNDYSDALIIYEDICAIIQKHLSETGAEYVIEALVARSNGADGRFVTELLEKHNMTLDELEWHSGLEKRLLYAVRAGTKKLPQHQFYALCLFFRLTMQEINEAMTEIGYTFSDNLVDLMFKAFIKEKRYGIDAYVSAVTEIASMLESYFPDELELSLPKFFYSQYTNKTIDDVHKRR